MGLLLIEIHILPGLRYLEAKSGKSGQDLPAADMPRINHAMIFHAGSALLMPTGLKPLTISQTASTIS